MKCLWDFYTFQHTYMSEFYVLAVLEMVLLVWVGYYAMKRNRKKRKMDLKILSLIMVVIVPPLEMFLTCYPPFVAYFKNILLIVLLWTGVGIWHLYSKIMEKIKRTKNHQQRVFGLKPSKKFGNG